MHRPPLPQQLPSVAAAALVGALGLLGTSHHIRQATGPEPASAPSTASTGVSDPSGAVDNANGGAALATAGAWLRQLLPSAPSALPSLPSLLLTVAHADASGYDAVPAAAPPPPPPGNGADYEEEGEEEEGEPDTITGVFHRLDPQRAQLVLVQVVFRHGARTPLTDRKTLWTGQQWDVCGEAYKAAGVRLFSTAGVEDPLSRHDQRQRSVVMDGGCRKGELTLVGQGQARDLGAWLRGRYVDKYGFLPQGHTEGVVQARTTNVSRTIATLRGVLTGLYPDLPTRPQQHAPRSTEPAAAGTAAATGAAAAAGKAEGQLPRVTTSGDLDEILYADTKACPHLGSFQAMQRATGRAAIRSDPDYEWARGELMRLLPLGVDAATFDTQPWIFTEVHDVVTSLKAHGKPLPPGLEEQPQLLEAVNRLATKEFACEVAPSVRDQHGRAVLRLSMGRLLHALVGNMRAAEAAAGGAGGRAAAAAAAGGGSSGRPPKMFMYSGHDSTIMPLLSALGMDILSWPPYLSNLVIEMWQLPTPPPPHKDNKDTEATQGQQAEVAVAAPPPRFVVRVLYNQDQMALPHCPPGFQPSLQTFEREVVGPFLLSSAAHADLCAVGVAHDTSRPQAKARVGTKATATA